MSFSISAISALIVSGAGTASSDGGADSVRLVLLTAGAAAVRKGWQRVLAPCISGLRDLCSDMAIKRVNLSLLKKPKQSRC